MFAKEPSPSATHFSLVGTRTNVALLRQPLENRKGDITLSFTFSLKGRREATASHTFDPDSALRSMLHESRVLLVLQGTRGLRFQYPQRVRRAARKMLRAARDLRAGEPCPALAEFLPILVNRKASSEDVTLQIVIVLSQWGLVEISEEDRKAFVKYLCGMFRKPEKFASAAEEAISYLFTNWVMPQDWRDLRRYARKTVWACYIKGARGCGQARPRAGNASPHWREDWPESQADRSTRGKRRPLTSSNHLSAARLAVISQVDPRRIYDAIRTKKLPAVKIGQSLRIENTSAQRFLLQVKQKRDIFGLKSQLARMGKGREAIRKQIYRLRVAGASESEIIKRLKTEVASREDSTRKESHG